MKSIIFLYLALTSSISLSVPVFDAVAGAAAPQMQYNTGVAGYGMGNSGWIQSVMFDFEFSKPKEVNQFFKQTYFKVEPRPSAAFKQVKNPVDSGLLIAVDDAFNNKGLLKVNVTDVSEPPLVVWILFLGLMILFGAGIFRKND